jgi:hypothetical protein
LLKVKFFTNRLRWDLEDGFGRWMWKKDLEEGFGK